MTSAQPTNTFLLHSVNILTFDTSSTTPTSSYILIQDGLISAIETGAPPSSLIESLPKGTPILDKSGCTLMPGFIDGHVHLADGVEEGLKLSVKFGATTVCDMHNEPRNLIKLRDIAQNPANRSTHADLKYCGIGATIDKGWPEAIITQHDKSEATAANIATWPKLSNPSDAPGYVQAQVSLGASYIKLFHETGNCLHTGALPVPPLSLQSALVASAHQHNLLAVAHALSYSGTAAILSAGCDGLTHCFFDIDIADPANEKQRDEIIALYKTHGAHLNPTLSAIGSLTGQGLPLQQSFADSPLGGKFLSDTPYASAPHFPSPRASLTSTMGLGAGHGDAQYAYNAVRVLHDAGVRIVVGSDAAPPARGTAYGLSVHQELRLLVRECGFSAREAVWCATAGTAERFGWMDRGVVEVGRRADLCLVRDGWERVLSGENEGAGPGGEYCLPILGVWREGVVVEGWEDVMQ